MEELKLDACPNPRKEVEKNNLDLQDEERTSANPEDTTKKRTFKEPKSNKKSYESPTNAYANVINISNSMGIQIGSTYQISINKRPDKSEERDEITKTDQIIRLFALKEEVVRDHLMFISNHICIGWKKIGLYFNYSSGQINQFYEDYSKSGIKEVIYQLLLDWIQTQPDEAKLCNLANALWECGERDAVRRLAKKIFS